MDHDQIDHLRKHPAWSLLRANNAALVLSFLTSTYIDRSAGNISSPELVSRLDDHLFAVNQQLGEERYPRSAKDYLEEWADAEHGWLRRFYPPGSDEPHFDLTPAAEKAAAWVDGLGDRTFIGTESRLTMLIELLRQLVVESDDDPAVRRLTCGADVTRRRGDRTHEPGGRRRDPVVQRTLPTVRPSPASCRRTARSKNPDPSTARRQKTPVGPAKGERSTTPSPPAAASPKPTRPQLPLLRAVLTAERQDELTDC